MRSPFAGPAVLCVLTLLGGSGPARGNGAFPDSLQILLPAGRPNELGLSTNFGLILSDDGAQTWRWVCEGDLGDPLYSAYLYQVGPAPTHRLVAVTPESIVSSLDNACTWQAATGAISDTLPTDVFSDPTDPQRLLAIGLPSGAVGQLPRLYESRDGGRTFDTVLFQAPATGGLISVEIARSEPRTIYLTWFTTSTIAGVSVIDPKLARSNDGGATWESIDLGPSVGANSVRIIAVDPEDAKRLFLRVLGAVEKLGISDDGGTTIRTPVEIPGSLSGFARMPGGVLIVGGTIPPEVGAVAQGVVLRSGDGGQTFTPWPQPPRVRGLGQRDGTLYVAGDNFVDGFALAAASDDGATITPLMRYDSVTAIKGCVRSSCATQCRGRAALMLWPESVCGTTATGSGGAGGNGGAPPPSSGCGCVMTGPSPGSLWGLLLALLVVFRRARR